MPENGLIKENNPLFPVKHCKCKGDRNKWCCPDGWKVTLAGSSLLTPAKLNYASV